MQTILQVENLNFEYPDKSKALNNVSFSIEKGSKVFFHGENGAGKTTLFQCLNGLLKVKHGIIKIFGHEEKKEQARMRKISIVFQNANDQMIAGSVFDEVSFGPVNLGLTKEEALIRTENAMKIMNIMHLKDKPPHFLSYGQKKRVAIASILSMEPDIIILDEPTAGLDPKQTEELIQIIDNLADKGKTLLISTHNAEFSYRCADKIVVLSEGSVICDGEPQYVFSKRDVLDKTGMIKPVIMEVYEALIKQSFVKFDKVPRNREQLISALRGE